MKKKLFLTLTIVALLCAAVIFTACGEKNDAKYGEYKNIAFATVGIENQNVQYSNVTEENGSFTVKIVIDGITYDVTIGADKTVKSVKINDHNVSKDELPEAPFENETTYIGKEAAKNIAFADAGVTANQVTSKWNLTSTTANISMKLSSSPVFRNTNTTSKQLRAKFTRKK